MADETPPNPAPEPTSEPEPTPQPDPEIAALRAEVNRLSDALQTTRQPRGDSMQAVAAVQAAASDNPLAQVVLEVGAAVASIANKVNVIEERQKSSAQIPAQDLAAAEEEFATGNYGSLLAAHYARLGRDVAQGKVQPRPQAKVVQTVTRSAPAANPIEDGGTITAAQLREALQGPNAAEVHRKYKAGKLTVVRG